MLALLACKQGDDTQRATPTVNPPAAAEPAVTPTPQAVAPTPEPVAAPTAEPTPPPEERPVPTEASGRPVKLSSEEISECLKQVMHGHVAIPEQSFKLTVAGLGEISVLSSMSPNQREHVFHVYDSNGKRIQSLLNKNAASWNAMKLLAVMFPDVDGDGNQDFVTLASYTPPAGVQREFNAAGVFVRPGGGRFVFDASRSERASRGNPTSIAAAARAAR